MMKTKVIVCLVFAMSFTNLYAQNNTPKLTLQSCVDIALANNIPAKQSELLEQNAKLNYSQSKYNRLPIVGAEVNYGINNGRSIDPFTNAYNNQQLVAVLGASYSF